MTAPIIVIDTETTGFQGQAHTCIVEVGAVLLDTAGQEVSCFSSLVRPTKPWDERMQGALDIHGLTWSELQEAPTSDAVWRAFMAWGWLAPDGTQCTAFNVPFDRAVCTAQGWHLPWSGLCLMQRYEVYARGRGWMMGRKGKRLEDAATRLGILPGNAHRALDDARTAGAVWRIIGGRA